MNKVTANFKIIGDDKSITVYRKQTDKFGNDYFLESAAYPKFTDVFVLLNDIYPPEPPKQLTDTMGIPFEKPVDKTKAP